MAGRVTALVVGDDGFRSVLRDGPLAELGYDVIEAEAVESAWNALLADRDDIHLTLLEHAGARVSARGVLERLRSHPELSLVPAVVLSPTADDSETADMIQAGAFHHLHSPCDPRVLASVARAAVEGRRRLRQLQSDVRAHGDAMALLTAGTFRFRTPREAGSLAAALSDVGPNPQRLAFGLIELLMNAVEHGNLGIGYAAKSALKDQNRLAAEIEARLALPENRDKVATVSIQRDADRLVFTVADSGRGFDWRRYVEMEPERAFDTHGRGIVLARAFSFDSLEYAGCGNRVVATVLLTPDAA